jgi:hypothetical protein
MSTEWIRIAVLGHRAHERSRSRPLVETLVTPFLHSEELNFPQGSPDVSMANESPRHRVLEGIK